jgi:hypothetical protein
LIKTRRIMDSLQLRKSYVLLDRDLSQLQSQLQPQPRDQGKPLALDSKVRVPTTLEIGRGPLPKRFPVESSPLPTKRFQRVRQISLRWFNGHSYHFTLHPWVQWLQIPFFVCLIFAPILLVRLVALPHVRAQGNLPYYDCT